MSPAILRVGGSPADWLFFDKPLSVLQAAGLRPNVTVATSMQQLAVILLSLLCKLDASSLQTCLFHHSFPDFVVPVK